MKKPRVLLADQHPIVLAGVCKLIESWYEVVGMVENGQALLPAAQQLKPDLILLDISMPHVNGLEATRQIKRVLPDTKVLFFATQASPQYATQAFEAGGHGYLLKGSVVSELYRAIESVLLGKYYLTPALTKPIIDQALKKEGLRIKGSITELTPRQRVVLQLIGEGKKTREIAELLGLSIKTVEFHKNCIMKELEIHTTMGLARYAIEQGHAIVES